VGLNVDVLGAEELFGPADGEVLGDVHDLAAAVIALAGYPSAYLFVITEPTASSTASETKFSDAMSSRLRDWRTVSS